MVTRALQVEAFTGSAEPTETGSISPIRRLGKLAETIESHRSSANPKLVEEDCRRGVGVGLVVPDAARDEVGEARRVGNAGVLVQEASGAGNDVVHYVERRPSQRMVREQPIGPPACRR